MKVVYLGKLTDLAGKAESEFWSSSGDFDWPDIVALMHDYFGEEMENALHDERIRVAVNGKVLSDKETLVVQNGDEIALLPPVSGG